MSEYVPFDNRAGYYPWSIVLGNKTEQDLQTSYPELADPSNEFVYILRDIKTGKGKVLKVGKTSGNASRLPSYRAKAKKKDVNLAVDIVQINHLGLGAEWVESQTREKLLPDAEDEAGGDLPLPWDNTGSRRRRAGWSEIRMTVRLDRYTAWARAAGDRSVNEWLADLADAASGRGQ